MNIVDPDFLISYDLRQTQEAVARSKRHTNNMTSTTATTSNEHDTGSSTGPIRLAIMALLAVLGIGTGFQLGRDQYNDN